MDAEHPGGILCSQGLYDFYSKPGNHISNDPQIGALVFYGASKTQINHVAICVSKKKMAEAAHGDRTLIMPEDAIRKGAYTKISPIRFDFHLQGIFMPHYPEYQNP